MPKNLVIVESPAKAKTIENYLGKDYVVKSSFGHVRDLSEKGLSVDIANHFAPEYVIPSEKKKVIAELKKLAKSADCVWLASDEDREGEAIAWHLAEALDLKEENTRRIVFNEITKSAILKAIENPRGIDYNLVNAQQARRILDRLVGYELSPILWKKIKPSLSAGRVQSVAVRLIVERERERSAFQIQSYYRVTAVFQSENKSFKAELSQKFSTRKEALNFLNTCLTASFSVSQIEQKPGVKSPSAPFTTSTLQQEASRKLGYSVARTMQLAQRLYESGKITYMRTDSVHMSDFALQSAEQAIYQLFGKQYHKRRQYTTKSKGAQEAHECIRPVDMSVSAAGADNAETKLYDLIWKRSIASQMADAQLEKTQISILSPVPQTYFIARGEVLTFDGFLKVYMESSDDDEEESSEQHLPALKQGDALQANAITATERFTMPPARYTEASLVKKLEELGIGRPSTYAPTISTIQNRGYVVKEERPGTTRSYHVISCVNGTLKEDMYNETTGAEKNKLFPTDIGALVNDFLVDNFKEILDFHFTANVEKEFDEIATGNLKWVEMIESFYKPFHHIVDNTEKHSSRVTGKRELGVHPATRKPVYALIGRYGPMIQIGQVEDEEKPQYASLRKGQSIENISLEEALDLFKLPRKVGVFEDKEITIGIGRFGPYIKHDTLFASIPAGLDPMTITIEQAIDIIIQKREAVSNRVIHNFEGTDIQVLKGRFGPYISFGKLNYRIPKGTNAESLTLEEVQAIIVNSQPTGRSAKKDASAKNASDKKKKAAKKPAKKTTQSKTPAVKKTAAKTSKKQ
ncbi:MAG: type I DNA topoisomerase [Flavobacteriales bacterium]|nr:type I DNA topoisomerase [Flavobacteriales bacterium]